MSSIRRHREITIDALNQIQRMDLPWIHSLIPLLPAVLKKIGEDQIDAMIIAPLWPGQISYTELVNEYVLSHMFGWNNEILEPRTLLIMKNLKLPSDKQCCFLMDRRPERYDFIWREIKYPKKILSCNRKPQEMDPNQPPYYILVIMNETIYDYYIGTSFIHISKYFSKHCTSVYQQTLLIGLSHIRHRFKEFSHAPIHQKSDLSTHDRQTEIQRHIERGNTI
ncbi:MAG: hypothetical protein EZS28_005688 [Streblomastix strix]|uniref:Uncharacterized protein n=1 Tax=Streblomastix strix TaxID=222440 RepID=A0A5J4WW96_9EUKA|nr:MAG: hypothetical protein EZS28_005688 [Streblomastix strix]